jgi:glycosyltransferase involved in cell wall biosynthesis
MPVTDPPVRILHVAQATATGVAVYVTSLAKYQIDQGMDARIACPPWGLLDEWVRRDGLPRFTWTADRQPGRALPRELRDLRAIVDEFDPDIVHLTSSKAGLAGRLVLRGRRPTVFSPEAWSFLLPGWTRRPSLMWERFATRWTTQVLVACEEEAAAGRAAGVHATYAVAEHGVDIEVFGYADDAARAVARSTLGLEADAGPLVVCAGRLCYQKGQKPLLEAWRQVRAQVPASRLLLVGDGEDEADLLAMAHDGVDFVGNQADMAPWYAAADLAVQPSRYEALSFSVLEALSVGRSVVAFDGIGMRTAIGPDAGALVPMDDVDGLAAAIVERLEDPARCAREGQAGRDRVVDRFRLDQLGANATRAVRQVLDRPTPPRPSLAPTGSGTPTFLVIGAARSGTTYLTRQLASHPQIGVSEPKEPHFLALAGETPAFTGPGDDETINRLAITDEAGWRSLFAGHAELRHRGEGSVSTLYYADESIRNIQRHCPDAKMIVLLRDPVERAYSAHQYWRSRGFETETFTRGLDLERERIEKGYHHIWHYTEMGRYSDQLGRFFAAFDRDRFLVLSYEDFMADRPAGLSRCFEFLGVDHWDPPDVDLDINAGGNPRSRMLTEGMRRVRTVEPARRVLRATVPFSVRERVRARNLRREDMPAADRARLEAAFASERESLRALLGADAPSWARR